MHELQVVTWLGVFLEVIKDPTAPLAGNARSRPPPSWRMPWPQLCGRTRPGSASPARSSAASCAVQVSLGRLQTQISCLHAMLFCASRIISIYSGLVLPLQAPRCSWWWSTTVPRCPSCGHASWTPAAAAASLCPTSLQLTLRPMQPFSGGAAGDEQRCSRRFMILRRTPRPLFKQGAAPWRFSLQGRGWRVCGAVAAVPRAARPPAPAVQDVPVGGECAAWHPAVQGPLGAA